MPRQISIDFDRFLTGDDDDDDDGDEPTKEQCKKYITQACPKAEKGKTPFDSYLIKFNVIFCNKLQFVKWSNGFSLQLSIIFLLKAKILRCKDRC